MYAWERVSGWEGRGKSMCVGMCVHVCVSALAPVLEVVPDLVLDGGAIAIHTQEEYNEKDGRR